MVVFSESESEKVVFESNGYINFVDHHCTNAQLQSNTKVNEQKTGKTAKEQNVEMKDSQNSKFKDYFQEFVPFQPTGQLAH